MLESYQNSLPVPTVLLTPIEPPINSTNSLLITRPMPVPLELRSCRAVEGWRAAGVVRDRPWPVSVTLMRTRP